MILDSEFQSSDIQVNDSLVTSQLGTAAPEDTEELSISNSSLAQAISKSIKDEQAENEAKVSDEDSQLMKVSDLAKMLGFKTKDLMDKAAAKGIEIKSNRAKLSPELVNEIKGKI